MSDTARDLNDAVAMARRTASQSVNMLKSTFAKPKSEWEQPAMPLEAANEPAPAPTPAPARPEPTVVSASTEMKGSLSTPDEMLVHGKIEGDVRASKITIGATGSVKGDVTAETVIVHGAIEGSVHGMHVRFWAGASVKGEVTHGSLGIDTAAVFEGTVRRIEAAPAAIAAE